MLREIIELLLSLLDVGESKLRAVRESCRRTCSGLILLSAGVLIGVFAVVMLFLAAFWAICSVLGPSLAGVLTGGAALLLAMFLVVLASWRAR